MRREGSGYALSCDPDRIDAHRFTELLALARDSDDDELRIVDYTDNGPSTSRAR